MFGRPGMPIENLTSMAALLSPDVADKVIDAYWQKNGETPAAFTIDLAGRFVAIARETKCLDEARCEQLEEMAYELDTYRDHGLTDKNLALIRQVYSPGVWARVLELPRLLLIEAYRQRAHSPVRAAVTAQLAVAIVILTVAPIRLANLTAIRIDTNLIRPGGIDTNYWLQFPNYDVKNRVRLDFPLDEERTDFITKYIHDFRPTLLRGRNEDWLFPGQRQGAKQKVSFSGQITDRIYANLATNVCYAAKSGHSAISEVCPDRKIGCSFISPQRRATRGQEGLTELREAQPPAIERYRSNHL
jgi:hypothetical protein